MVAAFSSPLQPAAPLRDDTPEQEKVLSDDGRTSLALAEKSNGGARKAKHREITSRYKAGSTASPATAIASGQAAASTAQVSTAARRHPSPNLGRSIGGDPPVPKRALSAERRRPWPASSPESKRPSPSASADGALWQTSKSRLSGRGPELLWPSSQSKQGQSSDGQAIESAETKSPRPVGESRPALNNTLKPSTNGMHRSVDSSGVSLQRKGSPMRRQSTDQTENPRPDYLRTKPDLHRWPSSSIGKVLGAAMTRSMDLSGERERQFVNRSSTYTAPGRTVTSSVHGVSSASRPNRTTASSLVGSARNFSRSVNEGPVGPVSSPGSRSSTPERRGRSKVLLEPPPNNVDQEREKPGFESSDSRTAGATFVRKSSQEAVLAGESDSQSGLVDVISDSESVSSGGSGTGSRMCFTKGTTVPARVWQAAEASRSRRLSEGGRLHLSMNGQDLTAAAKVSRKLASAGGSSNANTSSSAWSLSSARNSIPSFQLPGSPARGRVGSSPLRGLPSPTRTRPPPPNVTIASRTPPISNLNFGSDLRSRGKKAMSQQEEALLLRILHNRYLQWRFVNARADGAMQAQTAAAEKSLYNIWLRMSELGASVTTQRIKLQQAKHFRKLKTIISFQYDHATALLGVVEALEASILRVPVTGGARAEVQAVKEALGSAVDVLNAVDSSVKYLLPKAQTMDTLVSQLADTAAQERALLAECLELLSTAASLEIEERSLSTHLVQIQHERVANQ